MRERETNRHVQVYYWSTIRKLKANYHACRGVQEDLVCKILQEEVVINKDAAAAHKRLLELPGIAKYSRALRSDDEKEHFERHLRKYINIYLPDCPFEVDTTNRYTINTAEACIKARKTIKKGESIRYLSGIQVEMTEKEEKELSSRTDFSIVLSSRRKRPSLFLGPARFANHDCDSNARLNTTGPHGIHIVACKDIAKGDEITVTYGEDYFGIDNCECLCATCESCLRNGWDPEGPILPDDSSDEEEEEEPEPVRPKRAPKREERSEPSSSLGKRKRESDRLGESSSHAPKKRGRPRKYPRPEDDLDDSMAPAATPDSWSRVRPSAGVTEAVDDGYNSHEGSAQDPRDGMGRFLPRRSESAVGNAQSNKRKSSVFGRPKRVSSRDQSVEPAEDHLLERIFNLLISIGDRKLKQRDSKCKTSRAPSVAETSGGAATEVDAEAEEASSSKGRPHNGEVRFAKRATNSSPSTITIPSYTRGLSLGSDDEAAESIKSSAPKSQLPRIKKERSVSSLSNVMNADRGDVDIFSVPATPVPLEAQRRKRGRPPKDQSSDESTDSSDSSSLSSNNDSSSASSQASSATSLGDFAAGTIAASICEMLTVDNEKASTYEQEGTTIALRDGQAACDETEVDDNTQASKAGPTRDRKAAREGPRKVLTENAIPPMDSIEQKEPEEASESGEKRGEPRRTGDYYLCPELLPTTYHRWVECRNCDEFFVQGDAYLTRIACPRCERHSKLYGYWWPKTDKDGKSDTEERVLDHRTINRFLDPEEERNERKGRKTLADVIRDREMSGSRFESEESDGVDKRLRNSPRRSEGKRKLRTTM